MNSSIEVTPTTIHVQNATFITNSTLNSADQRLVRAMRLSQKVEDFLRKRFKATGNGMGECLNTAHSEVRKLDPGLAKLINQFVPIRNVLTHYEHHQLDENQIDEVITSLGQALARHTSPVCTRPSLLRPRQVTICRSGLGDFTSLAEAFSKANSGDTLFIMPGVYTESLSITKAVSIVGRGEQPNEVVIENNGDVLDIESDHVHLENLTLRTLAEPRDRAYAAHIFPEVGEVRFLRCQVQALHGTGIIARAKSTVYLADCQFQESHLALRAESNVTLERCAFSKNQTGLLARHLAVCVVEKCAFEGHQVAVDLRDAVRVRLVGNNFGQNEICIVAYLPVNDPIGEDDPIGTNNFSNCSRESRFVQIDPETCDLLTQS